MAHNPLFTRLVDESDDRLLGMVAYGIYKNAKKQWVLGIQEDKGRDPTARELADYAATWTPQLIETATASATSALAEFAAVAIDEAKPGIIEAALRGGAVKSVLLSMLSALLYTLALIVVAIVLKAAGIDLLSVVGAV